MFQVRFFGVRGSIATAGDRTARVGGNTSCVEVRAGGDLFILDAGTGLRALGDELLRRSGALPVLHAHLLLSHLHWDHIQGFPFFVPAYRPGCRVDLYGPAASDAALRAALAAQMSAPHFPVGLDAMRGTLAFHGVASGDEMAIGETRLRTAPARHPNGCLAWRLEHDGHALVYATDHEHGDGEHDDDALIELARGADLLIYDAQYTPSEYLAGKQGWGHSTWAEGVRIARAAGCARLALFHHDPSHDDWEVARIEAEARAAFPGAFAAREGHTIALDDAPAGARAAAA